MKENLLRNSSEIQREIPIKSSNPFLYEYWKVFSYLYMRKIAGKFAQINEKNYSPNLLKTISLNNLMNKDEKNSLNSIEKRSENEKEKQKDTISLNSFNSLINQNIYFNNGINNNYQNVNSNEVNNVLLQAQKQNLINVGTNYINPVVTTINPNSQNNNILNNYQAQKIQNIPNNFNVNGFYPSQNLIQNNFGKDNKNNIPYFQIPFKNQILQPVSPSIISSNNIINNSIPGNLIINNNNANIKNNNYNSKENNNNKPKKEENHKEKNTEKNSINSSSIQFPNHQSNSKIHKVFFNIRESIPKDGNLLNQKRRRFLKNNKLVFLQMDENELSLKNEKEIGDEKTLDFQKSQKPRGSRFRGVSKNGSQWQVLIMVKKKKRYLGSFPSEEEAARAYDKVALQNHGNKAKTNYDYSKEEVEKIIQGPKLLKVE